MRELDELIKEEGQWIKIYLGKEVIDDPEEQNVNVTLFNPVPVKALVTDLTSAQMKWKIYGIETEQGKELVIKNKYRTLIEQSQKIEIKGVDYIGWRDNFGQMQIREEGNYLRIYIYRIK